MPNSSNKPKQSPLPAIIVILVLFLVLAAMSYSPMMRCVKASDRNRAVNQGKNLFVALTGFAKDHDGLYPCEETGKADTVEECFTQLLETEHLDEEEIFYVQKHADVDFLKLQKPNNNGIVEPGENVWGYVKGLTDTSSTSTPLIFDCSVTPGVFSPEPWKGKAIIVMMNGSATAMDIEYGGSKPYNDDDKSKVGPILETHDGQQVDIFSKEALPEGTEIMLPTRP